MIKENIIKEFRDYLCEKNSSDNTKIHHIGRIHTLLKSVGVGCNVNYQQMCDMIYKYIKRVYYSNRSIKTKFSHVNTVLQIQSYMYNSGRFDTSVKNNTYSSEMMNMINDIRSMYNKEVRDERKINKTDIVLIYDIRKFCDDFETFLKKNELSTDRKMYHASELRDVIEASLNAGRYINSHISRTHIYNRFTKFLRCRFPESKYTLREILVSCRKYRILKKEEYGDYKIQYIH